MPKGSRACRGSAPQAAEHWRRSLRNELGWLLAAKLAALTLLWVLFFRS